MLIQIVEDDRALSDGVKLALQEPDIYFPRVEMYSRPGKHLNVICRT